MANESYFLIHRDNEIGLDYICLTTTHVLQDILADLTDQDILFVLSNDGRVLNIRFCIGKWQLRTDYSSMNVSVIASHKDVLDSRIHGANMGPTWVLSAPDGTHVDPMNLAIRSVAVQAKLTDNKKVLYSCFP